MNNLQAAIEISEPIKRRLLALPQAMWATDLLNEAAFICALLTLLMRTLKHSCTREDVSGAAGSIQHLSGKLKALAAGLPFAEMPADIDQTLRRAHRALVRHGFAAGKRTVS